MPDTRIAVTDPKTGREHEIIVPNEWLTSKGAKPQFEKQIRDVANDTFTKSYAREGTLPEENISRKLGRQIIPKSSATIPASATRLSRPDLGQSSVFKGVDQSDTGTIGNPHATLMRGLEAIANTSVPGNVSKVTPPPHSFYRGMTDVSRAVGSSMLPMAAPALAGAPIPTILGGAAAYGGGKGLRLGGSLAGADPETRDFLEETGNWAGGFAGQSTKILGGVTGAFEGAGSQVSRNIVNPIKTMLGKLIGGTGASAVEAATNAPNMYKGMKAGAADKPWIDPSLIELFTGKRPPDTRPTYGPPMPTAADLAAAASAARPRPMPGQPPNLNIPTTNTGQGGFRGGTVSVDPNAVHPSVIGTQVDPLGRMPDLRPTYGPSQVDTRPTFGPSATDTRPAYGPPTPPPIQGPQPDPRPMYGPTQAPPAVVPPGSAPASAPSFTPVRPPLQAPIAAPAQQPQAPTEPSNLQQLTEAAQNVVGQPSTAGSFNMQQLLNAARGLVGREPGRAPLQGPAPYEAPLQPPDTSQFQEALGRFREGTASASERGTPAADPRQQAEIPDIKQREEPTRKVAKEGDTQYVEPPEPKDEAKFGKSIEEISDNRPAQGPLLGDKGAITVRPESEVIPKTKTYLELKQEQAAKMKAARESAETERKPKPKTKAKKAAKKEPEPEEEPPIKNSPGERGSISFRDIPPEKPTGPILSGTDKGQENPFTTEEQPQREKELLTETHVKEYAKKENIDEDEARRKLSEVYEIRDKRGMQNAIMGLARKKDFGSSAARRAATVREQGRYIYGKKSFADLDEMQLHDYWKTLGKLPDKAVPENAPPSTKGELTDLLQRSIEKSRKE